MLRRLCNITAVVERYEVRTGSEEEEDEAEISCRTLTESAADANLRKAAQAGSRRPAEMIMFHAALTVLVLLWGSGKL